MDKNISDCIDQLCEVVLNSPVYQEYHKQMELVKNQQDVMDKINEIRNLNLRLNSIQNSDEAYEEHERLERRFEGLSYDQRVFDFIEAENRMIGLYREANRRLMERIQFI